MSRAAYVILATAFIAALGCDRAPQAPPGPPATAPAGRERIEVRVVALLAPNRPTHLARSDDGTIWWVQESDNGHDVAFALGADGVPRATALTSAAVLAALDLAQSPRASGNFHSLAAARDGAVWFYFAGGAGRRAVSCAGRFDPATGAVRIVIGPGELEDATGMGASLVLARGTLVAPQGGQEMWLWVRHSDAARVLRIEPRGGTYRPAFDRATTASGQALSLTRPGLAIGATAAADALLLLDPGEVELWQIDPAGRATSLHALIGLSSTLSAPVGDAAGRAVVVAADGPVIPARTDAETQRVLPLRYPALLIIDPPGTLRALGRELFTAPDRFDLHAMRLRQLLAEPQPGSLLAYDDHSGALLRLQLLNQP